MRSGPACPGSTGRWACKAINTYVVNTTSYIRLSINTICILERNTRREGGKEERGGEDMGEQEREGQTDRNRRDESKPDRENHDFRRENIESMRISSGGRVTLMIFHYEVEG